MTLSLSQAPYLPGLNEGTAKRSSWRSIGSFPVLISPMVSICPAPTEVIQSVQLQLNHSIIQIQRIQ